MHGLSKHNDVTTPADARLHRVSASDPFRLTENPAQRAIASHLLGDRAVGMAEVGELLSAA